jgi:hypothetical protein
MSNGGWGLPLYENDLVKADGDWKFSGRMGGDLRYQARRPRPFTVGPAAVGGLMYPLYYIVLYHYANPATGEEYEVPMGEAEVITPQR